MWFYVSAYGDVQPCCFFPVSFGSIKDRKLADILDGMWKSPLLSEKPETAGCPVNDRDYREKFKHFFDLGRYE